MSPWENYHLEWSADPLSVTIPTWQDITAYALAPSGSPINIAGGVPTMGSSAQSTVMSVWLDNTDHRFTFGNTSSPLYPNWKPGRRIRCYETIAGRRFDHFSGYMRPPETGDWAERGIDQYVIVTAIDRLGWLANAKKFNSTLAEYILYNGGTSLVGFWPMTDPAGAHSATQLAPGGLGPLSVEGQYTFSPISPAPDLLTFGAATPPVGDDVNYVQFKPVLNATASAVAISNRLANRNLAALSMLAATNPYVAIVGWIRPDPTSTGAYQVLLLHDNASVNTLQITFSGTGSGSCYVAATNVFGGTTVTATAPPRWGEWQLYSARINNATGDIDFWVDTAAYTGTTGGASNGTMDIVVVDNGSPNQAVGQVQIYAGSGYTRAAHLAQYQAGLAGLRGQTTGQRIITLAQYAGVPTAELGLIDPGVAVMQTASLGGKDPLTPMREAETTEQGRLRTNGQGLIVFDPRTRRYAR